MPHTRAFISIGKNKSYKHPMLHTHGAQNREQKLSKKFYICIKVLKMLHVNSMFACASGISSTSKLLLYPEIARDLVICVLELNSNTYNSFNNVRNYICRNQTIDSFARYFAIFYNKNNKSFSSIG